MATAYATLVSLLNDLDLIQNHPRHSFSFDNHQIESLLERLLFLIDFMETCDYHGEAEALENKIAIAAHAAEDVLLSHVADQIRSGSTLTRKTRPPRFLLCLSVRLKTRPSRFLLDLQKAIEGMDLMKAIEDMDLKKVRIAPSSSSAALASQKNTMVGFDEVLHQLLDLLTGEAGGRAIPIVAMGGAGKTTLARNAFEHKHVLERFDVRLWATISQQYDVERILEQLLSGLSKTASGVAHLGERLHKSLYRRRYLIVLDDLWSLGAWDEIKSYLPDDVNESRIVVTSRQSHLADRLSNSPIFHLNLLDEKNSWILFCEKVFGVKQDCPPELEVVGHKIVKNCRGLPLAIVVVGGHLRNSLRTQEYWENVANHMDSILSTDENDSCFDILSLSYNCLPVQLKPCFLYMGVLKDVQKIDVSSLIKLWIGEGFIKPSKTQSLEEIAEGCLKDLVDRNLILACERNWNGKIMSCELHDIVRELCLKIATRAKFLRELDTLEAIHRERRVVIHGSNVPERMCHFGKPHIRSQRVLNAVDGNFLAVGCHLRHLGCFTMGTLCNFNISPSISLLWSLQTLIVKSFYQSVTIPLEFWEMLQLRHLEIDSGISLLDPLPSDDGQLVQGNLQTLTLVANLRLSEEVCKRISHIKDLGIRYTDSGSKSDKVRSIYHLHNLILLKKLESLSCLFSDNPEWRVFAQSFKFPDSLRELSLTNCGLYWDELSMMAGSLPLLETLSLRFNAVIGSRWNTIGGHFDRLKSLTIYDANLVNFNVDSSHFPALIDLHLWCLPNLVELPSCIGELPSLQSIKLMHCKVSLAMAAMRILVEQEQDYGNEDLQLEVSFPGEPVMKRGFEEKMQEEGLESNNLYLH